LKDALVASRAALFFHCYYELGPNRSLRGLARDLNTAGIATSESTLKRYSKRYGWKVRIAELDADLRKRRRERSIQWRLDIEERHASLAREVQALGQAGLRRLLGSPERLERMTPAEITRLTNDGVSQERAAYGISQPDFAQEVWNDFIGEVAQVFLAVNPLPDERTRAARFASTVDALVDEKLGTPQVVGRAKRRLAR
jgi:hypothetical protein